MPTTTNTAVPAAIPDPDDPLWNIEWCGDDKRIFEECRQSLRQDRLISDACARMIATSWHGGQHSRSYAFLSTDAILADTATDPDDAADQLWQELFADTDLEGPWQLAADALAACLDGRPARGPIQGWSALWL